MDTHFLKMLFAMLVCFSLIQVFILGVILPSQSSYVKCKERERQALLNFIQGIRDHSGMLSTWRDNENNRDCCKWKGVECNNETGHVQMLDLRGQYPQYLTGAINITLLIDLKNIEHLDLSENRFQQSHIPKLMGLFTNLRYLDLSNSVFGGSILWELGNLSHLQYLNLGDNHYLLGVIPYQLGNLSQLRYLDLAGNSPSGAIPFQVGNLPILHTLRLGGNFDIKSKDAEWLSNLYSLKNLELNSLHNLGSSHRWLQMINKLIPNLRELSLVDCSLSDTDIQSLFHSHSNFSTYFTILDLSFNMLTSSTLQFLFNLSLNLQELYLSYNNIALSSPLYPNFPSLKILGLSGNNLTLSNFQGNFNFGSKLQKLYLHNCSLTDRSFLVSSTFTMNSSSSLMFLGLSYNFLKSSAIFRWLFNFTTNLHSLHLHHIPDEFGKVMNSLEVLTLDSNKLQGKIPASLGNIGTLQQLYLDNNNLSGEIPRHIFQPSILPNLSIFTSLRILELSNNRLSGEIPERIGLLYELESLHLEQNYLEGDITESHLRYLPKLKDLDFTDNSLSLKFGTSWVPPFQLFRLGLASCKLGPSFPSWLQTQSHLWFLDISDAGIDDFVPEWFWNKLQSISKMNMSYNSLEGTIPNLPIKLPNDDEILVYLNSNQLEGGIPVFLSKASTLDLSKNKISDLNTFLCGKNATTKMRILDLSNNQIMGQLPNCWEHLNSLQFLDVSNNKLSGKIPQSMDTLVNLEALVLRNNSLVGELPLTLKKCTHLVILDVSENLLSGPIPSWIGECLQQLKILSLRVNHFFGSVPLHLCYLRQIHLLDLSRNNLLEGIPTCLTNFTAMMERRIITSAIVRERKISSKAAYINFYDSNVLLMWKGQEYVYWNAEYLLKSIDLSSNDLTGEIPKVVGYLIGLVSLNLSRNNLNGEIPSELGNLNSLEFLDLCRNLLSGKIPSTLSNIDRLAMLDLSNNNLTGRIPGGRQLQTFDASSFEGNLDLCGERLNKTCPGDKTIVQPQEPAIHSEDDNAVFYESLYMSSGLRFFTGVGGLLGAILVRQPWRNAYLRFLNRLTDYLLVMVEMNIAKFHRRLKG